MPAAYELPAQTKNTAEVDYSNVIKNALLRNQGKLDGMNGSWNVRHDSPYAQPDCRLTLK